MFKNYFPSLASQGRGNAKYFDKPVGPFKELKNIFGIVQVHVTCPESIKLPILLHRYTCFSCPITGEVATICPVGKWTGWYFSEELKYAVELGYSIEILALAKLGRGYHFSAREKRLKYLVNMLRTYTRNARFILNQMLVIQ